MILSPSARARVRQWFNRLNFDADVAQGRAVLEKELQRNGLTALNLDKLAEDKKKVDDDLAKEKTESGKQRDRAKTAEDARDALKVDLEQSKKSEEDRSHGRHQEPFSQDPRVAPRLRCRHHGRRRLRARGPADPGADRHHHRRQRPDGRRRLDPDAERRHLWLLRDAGHRRRQRSREELGRVAVAHQGQCRHQRKAEPDDRAIALGKKFDAVWLQARTVVATEAPKSEEMPADEVITEYFSAFSEALLSKGASFRNAIEGDREINAILKESDSIIPKRLYDTTKDLHLGMVISGITGAMFKALACK